MQEIADIANMRHNHEKKGTVRGTHKHTFCKDFMEHIKRDNPISFKNVHPEYTTTDKKSRFDVVCFFAGNKAVVFDYKFGEEKNVSKPSDATQYQKSLALEGKTMVGTIRDIKPRNSNL